ncbi:MAG: right-handed parallel beta-helix repeat-containing protein, partial [Neisseria sp.]|nr:right-handed parallel beta-helix repeat-containing protein [Neisseria sp.]
MKGAVPVYVEEHHGNVAMHGAVTIHNNKISVREESAGYVEFAYLKSNAKEYNITNNTLKLGGDLNDALIDVHSTNPKGKASLNVANNKIMTDIKGELYDSWLRFENNIKTYSEGNIHNGEAQKKVNTTGSKVALSDILSEANHIVETTKETVYHHTKNVYTSGVEEHHTTTGIL